MADTVKKVGHFDHKQGEFQIANFGAILVAKREPATRTGFRFDLPNGPCYTLQLSANDIACVAATNK